MMPEQPSSALIVEDESPMRRFLRASLEAHGFTVLESATLREAMVELTGKSPQIVLLDLGLPDGDGIAFVRRIREFSQVPIVVVSARGREDDKVAALDAGADDYLTKPFGVGELLARLRASLRRSRAGAPDEAPPVIQLGDLTLDRATRSLTRGQDEIHLTPIEYRLLCLLVQHAGRVLTHRQMLREVWGPQYVLQSHTLRVHMAGLRKKVEADPARPQLIVTETGVGYRLRDVRG